MDARNRNAGPDATGAATSTADRRVVISRLIDAPRELVFSAWTNLEHAEKWWGPTGFRTTTKEADIRPDGVWRFTMHGPDGVDYLNRIVFIEIVKPERLVYRHTGEGDTEDIRFIATVTFEEQGGKTLLTMYSLFETAATRDEVVDKYGAIEGGKQHLERLADYIAGLS